MLALCLASLSVYSSVAGCFRLSHPSFTFDPVSFFVESQNTRRFKPCLSATDSVAEWAVNLLLLPALFAILSGISMVCQVWKKGLTVWAFIPVAIMALLSGNNFFRTANPENHIIQTIGSSGKSIAAGAILFILMVMTLYHFILSDINPFRNEIQR